eukprot:COSAG01_NODE_12163_length_1789_cov_1.856805_1_plen_246_part_00
MGCYWAAFGAASASVLLTTSLFLLVPISTSTSSAEQLTWDTGHCKDIYTRGLCQYFADVCPAVCGREPREYSMPINHGTSQAAASTMGATTTPKSSSAPHHRSSTTQAETLPFPFHQFLSNNQLRSLHNTANKLMSSRRALQGTNASNATLNTCHNVADSVLPAYVGERLCTRMSMLGDNIDTACDNFMCKCSCAISFGMRPIPNVLDGYQAQGFLMIIQGTMRLVSLLIYVMPFVAFAKDPPRK